MLKILPVALHSQSAQESTADRLFQKSVGCREFASVVLQGGATIWRYEARMAYDGPVWGPKSTKMGIDGAKMGREPAMIRPRRPEQCQRDARVPENSRSQGPW